MIAIAVGAFAQNHVRASGGWLGVADDGKIIAPHIAGEHHTPEFVTLAQLQHDRGAAEDVSSLRVHRAHAVSDIEPLAIRHADHLFERAGGILHTIKRLGMRTSMPLQKVGILFLDMRRVGEHERAEVSRGRGGPDGVPVTLRRQERQPACMVDVCMGEHHRVDFVDGQRESGILRVAFAALALKQPAVEQHGALAHAYDMAGAGDFLSGTGELDLHKPLLLR